MLYEVGLMGDHRLLTLTVEAESRDDAAMAAWVRLGDPEYQGPLWDMVSIKLVGAV